MTVAIEKGTSQAAPVDLDPLARFLDFKSPSYSIPKAHSPNKSTRPPKSFDMHLHKELRLKKVVVVNELPRIISHVCDNYIKPDHGFPSQLQSFHQEIWNRSKKSHITNEDGLVKQYSTLAQPFLTTASGLRFGTQWASDTKGLHWSEKAQVFYPARKEAIADGFLSTPLDRSKLLKEAQAEMALLDRYCLNHLAIWEFKSLICGPPILNTIPRLEGDFLWTACQERFDDNRRSLSCGSAANNHRVDGRPVVTGRRTGPDAKGDNVLEKLIQTPGRNGPKRKFTDPVDEATPDEKRQKSEVDGEQEGGEDTTEEADEDTTEDKEDLHKESWLQVRPKLLRRSLANSSDFEKLTSDERFQICGHDVTQQVRLITYTLHDAVVNSHPFARRHGLRLSWMMQPTSCSVQETLRSLV